MIQKVVDCPECGAHSAIIFEDKTFMELDHRSYEVDVINLKCTECSIIRHFFEPLNEKYYDYLKFFNTQVAK